jgi:hypothetical protein
MRRKKAPFLSVVGEPAAPAPAPSPKPKRVAKLNLPFPDTDARFAATGKIITRAVAGLC